MRKSFSVLGWYKRLFISERTALINAAASLLTLPAAYYFGLRSGAMDWAGRFDLVLRFALVITLFYALRKHKLLLLQAATVGLLFSLLSRQAQYTLSDLGSRSSVEYITMGLQGFIFLARELMILFMQGFICVNHFIIYAARRQEAVRVTLNQSAIVILLAFLILQLFTASALTFDRSYILYIWVLHVNEFFIFTLVACAELILMIDQREFVEG